MLSQFFGRKGERIMNRGPHDSRAIANIFVEKALRHRHSLTILPLVKFVYLAHGWTLGFTGKPLITHKVQAWKYGPVIPEVYYAFSNQEPNSSAVFRKAQEYTVGLGHGPYYEAELDEEQEEMVNLVYGTYSKYSPFQLSAMTHCKGSPWDMVKSKGHFAVIPNQAIQDYYKKLAAENG